MRVERIKPTAQEVYWENIRTLVNVLNTSNIRPDTIDIVNGMIRKEINTYYTASIVIKSDT